MDSGDEALKYLGLLDHDDLKPADSSSSISSNPPQHSSAELEVRDSLTQLKISFEISNYLNSIIGIYQSLLPGIIYFCENSLEK